MRSIAAALLLIACGKGGDGGLEIALRPPAVGATITEEEITTQVTTLVTPQRRTVITDRERKLSVERVLEVTGDAASKLEVEYRALDVSQAVDDGAPEAEPSRLVGKRYLVWRDGDEVRASAPDGTALPGGELDEVIEENRELGEVPRLARLVGGRRWQRGERVELDAGDLATMARARGEASLEARSGAVTWTALDAGVATFDVEMVLVQRDPQKTIESDLRTTVRVEVASGMPVEIVAAGTTSGKLTDGALAGVTIEGKIDGRSTFLVEAP